MSQNPRGSSLRWTQCIRFLIAALIGSSTLGLTGLALTGTMIAVVITAPVLLLFSPIIISSLTAVAIVTTGFMTFGGCLVSAVAWTYHYVTRKNLAVANFLNYLKTKIASEGRHVKERVEEKLNA